MSSSSKVTPERDCDSRVARDFVSSPVAKPGIVNARMSLRGRPRRSIALAATIRAWVESSPPETPMTIFGLADRPKSLLQPRDLDVVGLEAVQGQPLGIVGHEREAVDLAAQADVAGRGLEVELDGPEGLDPIRVSAAIVVEGALPEPFLAESVEVDVGHAALRGLGKALGLGEQVAALVDHRLAVPREVGGRLPRPGGGIEVRRVAARAGRAHEQSSILGAGDGDRAAREVREHGRAGQGGLGARRDRHPHVLAHLDVQVSVPARPAPRRSGPARTALLRSATDDRLPPAIVTGGEVPALVELAVVRAGRTSGRPRGSRRGG